MRTLGQVTVTRTDVIEIECDICGKKTDKYGRWNYEAGSCGSYSKVTIELEEVDYCPGDRSGKNKYFDICDDCFDKVVLPALEIAIGKKIHEQDFG